MIGVSVKGAERAAANLKAAQQGVRDAQLAGTRRATVLVERALKREMTQPGVADAFWGKKGSAGDGLAVRSGRTRASVSGAAYRVGERVTGVVGSKEKHLKLHEDGGVVRGTSPKGYARIPTAAALTQAGVDRNAGQSIRAIPGAFLFTSKSGRLWAAVRTNRRLVLLYLLVKSVTLRARNIFSRIARSETPRVVEALRSEVALSVQRANS